MAYADAAATACLGPFDLVEAQLGRMLRRGCCCSVSFSADEGALIGIARIARCDAVPADDNGSTSGLTEAILCAVRIIRGIVSDAAMQAILAGNSLNGTVGSSPSSYDPSTSNRRLNTVG